MITGIKKKFLDILFEDDDEYIDEVKKETVKKARKKNPMDTDASVDAKEVLYKKPKKSAFINLDEETVPLKQKEEKEKIKDDYEPSSQISPIFGMVNEKKKKETVKQEVDDSLINKPDDSHLDIITSPFYGYGQQDEHNYLPSEKNFRQSFDDDELPPFDDEDIDNDAQYEDNYDDLSQFDYDLEQYETHEDDYHEYEQDDHDYHEHSDDDLSENQNIQEEENHDYMGYYKANMNEENTDRNDIPYYDEKIYSDDYDVEDVNIFDDAEEE